MFDLKVIKTKRKNEKYNPSENTPKVSKKKKTKKNKEKRDIHGGYFGFFANYIFLPYYTHPTNSYNMQQLGTVSPKFKRTQTSPFRYQWEKDMFESLFKKLDTSWNSFGLDAGPRGGGKIKIGKQKIYIRDLDSKIFPLSQFPECYQKPFDIVCYFTWVRSTMYLYNVMIER